MTAKEALLLSLSHNLGSTRNTLVPGENVPAFTSGMDPNQWANQVKAIGTAKLTPAGRPGSLYEFKPDYGIGGLPGYSGLENTNLARKSPQDVANTIAMLAEALAPEESSAGGSDRGKRFASGRWVFGDTVSGMQSAALSSASLDEQSRQAARNYELSREQAANEARLKDQAAALAKAQWQRQLDLDNYTVGRDEEATTLAILDRLNQQSQQDFANRFSLSQLTGQQLNADAVSNAGRTAAANFIKATNQLTTAQQAWNDRVNQLAEAHNATAREGMQEGVVTETGADNIVRLKPEKNAGTKFNAIVAALSQSPEAARLQAAHTALTEAQVANQSVQYTPKVPGPSVALPTSNVAAQLQALLRGGPTAPTTPTAVPYITQDAARRARPAAAPPYTPPVAGQSANAILNLLNLAGVNFPSGPTAPVTGGTLPPGSDAILRLLSAGGVNFPVGTGAGTTPTSAMPWQSGYSDPITGTRWLSPPMMLPGMPLPFFMPQVNPLDPKINPIMPQETPQQRMMRQAAAIKNNPHLTDAQRRELLIKAGFRVK